MMGRTPPSTTMGSDSGTDDKKAAAEKAAADKAEAKEKAEAEKVEAKEKVEAEKLEAKEKVEAEKAAAKQAEVLEGLGEEAKSLCDVLKGPGVLDPETEYGSDFEAFLEAAEGSGLDLTGLDVSIMDEDVSDSRAYNKRVAGRKYWAGKLAEL
ncbi:hypothetical protein LCGC14_0424930 [marine sediment metagenome]|uniref:Uncharacterized protein n=1 Tax=marine sediment metagenome TaxID=412755 RepID=A0A0F9VBY4_9ZZZZ